jgi:hypothetical protein
LSFGFFISTIGIATHGVGFPTLIKCYREVHLR